MREDRDDGGDKVIDVEGWGNRWGGNMFTIWYDRVSLVMMVYFKFLNIVGLADVSTSNRWWFHSLNEKISFWIREFILGVLVVLFLFWLLLMVFSEWIVIFVGNFKLIPFGILVKVTGRGNILSLVVVTFTTYMLLRVDLFIFCFCLVETETFCWVKCYKINCFW